MNSSFITSRPGKIQINLPNLRDWLWLVSVKFESIEYSFTHLHTRMSTILGIFTFISMINTTSGSLKAKRVFIFQHFSFYEQLKFLK